MEIISQAMVAVRAAEESVRSLARAALDANLYSQLSTLAELAEDLRQIVEDLDVRYGSSDRTASSVAAQIGTGSRQAPRSRPVPESSVVQGAKAFGRSDQNQSPVALQIETVLGSGFRSASRSRPAYPVFLKDADRLVKVGWSKKERAEYEHRVPFDAVRAICQAVLSNFGTGTLFRVVTLLPFRTTEGVAVSDYQVYMTIKWLHTSGRIAKHGRDGYRLTEHMSVEAVEADWAKLSTYETR